MTEQLYVLLFQFFKMSREISSSKYVNSGVKALRNLPQVCYCYQCHAYLTFNIWQEELFLQ